MVDKIHYHLEEVLEVYNEQLRDLLAEDGTGEVHIREHPETGVYVEGAQETVVTQPHDMAEALVQGEKRRAVGATRPLPFAVRTRP